MKPNMVFLIADQFRGDCLGCDGHPDVQTPVYDALARRGTRFEKAYSPDPICVPARAVMITGNYPHKCTGFKSNRGAVRDGQVTLPELLAQSGYETYAAGKLHYVPYAPPGQPRRLYGFRHAALTESGRILRQFDHRGEQEGLEEYIDYLRRVGWGGYSRAHGLGNNDIHPAAAPLPAEHCPDSWVATQAIEYIEHHREQHPDRPFFLNVGFPKPHSPYDPPRPYDTMYDPRAISKPAVSPDSRPRSPHMQLVRMAHGFDYLSPAAVQVARAHYFGLISFQDRQAGRVIDCLERHDLLDNTIVVFTADHGDMMGDFGLFFKTCMYEGSVRVPLLISCPALLPAEQISRALVGLQDLMPTVLDLAGVDLPKPVDGRSLADVLRGTPGDRREFFVSYSLEPPQQTYMITDGRHKYVYSEMNAVQELYDLDTDPREEHDLIDESACRDVQETLKAALLTWICDNGDDGILDDGRLRQSTCDVESTGRFDASRMGWRWF